MKFVLEDANVHQVTEVAVIKGFREVKVRCGAELAGELASDRPIHWTGWSTKVTCSACHTLGVGSNR